MKILCLLVFSHFVYSGSDFGVDYKGIIVDKLKDNIYPTVIDTTGKIKNPLARYYLYFSPHGHTFKFSKIHLATSDDLEGPWRVQEEGPHIYIPRRDKTKSFRPFAAADVVFMEEYNSYFMWTHKVGMRTEWFHSKNGVRWEYGGEAINSKWRNSGRQNNQEGATYSRVYTRQVKGKENSYIMLYSSYDRKPKRKLYKKIFKRFQKNIYLATSLDGINWTQHPEALVEPADDEGGHLFDPFYITIKGRHFIGYHDNTSQNFGGHAKLVEVNSAFEGVGGKGKRYTLLAASETGEDIKRLRGTFIMGNSDGSLAQEKFHIFVEIGPRGKAKIGHIILDSAPFKKAIN